MAFKKVYLARIESLRNLRIEEKKMFTSKLKENINCQKPVKENGNIRTKIYYKCLRLLGTEHY